MRQSIHLLSLAIMIIIILVLVGCQSTPVEQQRTGQEQPPAQGNGSMQEDYLDEALGIIDTVEPENIGLT